MSHVEHHEFNLSHYLHSSKIKTERSFEFKDRDIGLLPFLADKSIDLKDSGIDKEKSENAYLVLRISKTKKAFYPVYSKMVRGLKKKVMGRKLGEWKTKPPSNHMPQGFLNTRGAREALYRFVEDQKLLSGDSERFNQLSIRDYVEGGYYTADRKVKPLKNGKFSVPHADTIKTILKRFPDIIDRKIGDVSEKWILEIKTEWENKKLTTGTMRGYYSTLNSLFNICVKKGYILNNPIDNHYYLFPHNDVNPQKNTYDWDYFEIVDFIFSAAFDDYFPQPRAANQAGKIIIATAIVAGVRPIEARRNFTENFDVENQTLFIPKSMESKTKTGRSMAIPHQPFWDAVSAYKSKLATNATFMFPSNNSKTGYVSESTYRYHWEAVRIKFNLSGSDLLYHNRHTFSTNLRQTPGGEGLHASMIGDNERTANKFYGGNTNMHAEKVAASMYENSRKTVKATSDDNVDADLTVANESVTRDDVVDATSLGMPDTVKTLFETYKNGKSLPGIGKMYKQQWDKFVSIVRQMSENNMIDDAEVWLMLQD